MRKSRRVGYCRERCYHWLAISYLALPMLRMATAALSCSPATEHELLVRAAEVSSLVFSTAEGNRTGYHGRRGVRRSPTWRAGLSLGRGQDYAPETALRIGIDPGVRVALGDDAEGHLQGRGPPGEPAAGAGGISPDQADGAAGPVRFHSGRAVSRSWKQAAVILVRRGIPVGLRRVLACSCADCRDAAAHRAE